MTDSAVFERARNQVYLTRTARLGHLYALVDACDIESVPQTLLPLRGSRAACLYDGTQDENLWAIGGWIVNLDEPLLRWVREELPRESWGVLLESQRKLPELLEHFRQFVRVLGPEGDEVFFRFYDPRVLTLYLVHATPEERRAFCSGLSRIGGWDDNDLLVWWHEPEEGETT